METLEKVVNEALTYTDDNIIHLDDREHIRRRPGMYIGKLGDGAHSDDGIYVLIKETIDNSIDEFIMGAGKRIEITIEGDKVHTNVEHSLILKPSNIGDFEIDEMDKDYLLEALKDLHIGEWRRHYNTRRFGYMVCDGTQWHLEIYFSNGYKPVKIYGDNAYPYNFDRLLELFEIEE